MALKQSKKHNPDFMNRQLFTEHFECHRDSVCIYTDGSKSNAGIGFEVVFPNFNFSGALPASASIFTAELMGF